MTRRLAVAAVLLGLSALPAARSQELVVGGEAVMLPSLTLSPRLAQLASPRLRTELQTIAGVYGERAELRAAATVWHEITDPASADRMEIEPDDPESPDLDDLQSSGVSLDELRLRLVPSRWAVVEVGRFRHRVGRAVLLSPNDTYTSVSFDTVARGDVDAAGTAQTLATATAFFGSASLTLVAVPVPAVPQLVEPGSIWIPRLPSDEVIDDPRISDDPVPLNEVFAERTRRILEPYRRVSGGAHAGVVAGPVDLLVFYYHGVDPTPVPRVFVDVAHGRYDLHVVPEEALIDSFGFAAESVAGSSTIWVDAALVPNKTIAATTIDPYSKRSRLKTAPTLAGVAGASYRAGGLDLLLLGEYYAGHSFLPDGVRADEVVEPVLANDLLLSARLRAGARSQWSFVLGGLVSFDDGGSVLSASVAWEPAPAVTASVQAPVFLGPADSDFGQYRDIVHVVSEIRVSY
ncbi:MAG: hypothetical protein ACOCW3_05545 [Spirochaetota bacterium]